MSDLEKFLAEIDDDINYLADGYYSPLVPPIIEKIREFVLKDRQERVS